MPDGVLDARRAAAGARGRVRGRARPARRRRRDHRRRARRSTPPRAACGSRLVEARDLAAGTSSASSKLIHGGLRYLEMGDIGLVREALRERELLLTRIAPHLVAPGAVPVAAARPRLGARLPRRRARALRHHRRRAVGAAPPAPEPPRRAGRRARRCAATRSSAPCSSTTPRRTTRAWSPPSRARPPPTAPTSPRACGSPASGAPARSRRSTRRPARRWCCGRGTSPAPPASWTDRLRELAGGRSSRRIVPSKGIHIFVAGDRIPMDTGVLARTEKSVLFVIPWQGGWLIGDTDTPWRTAPDQRRRHAAPTSTTCSRRRTRCWPSRSRATTSTA